MVIPEFYKTREDGVNLYRSYSNLGFKIERDGVIYDEAIDPEGMHRFYNEINELVQVPELSAEEALAIITGGEI